MFLCWHNAILCHPNHNLSYPKILILSIISMNLFLVVNCQIYSHSVRNGFYLYYLFLVYFYCCITLLSVWCMLNLSDMYLSYYISYLHIFVLNLFTYTNSGIVLYFSHTYLYFTGKKINLCMYDCTKSYFILLLEKKRNSFSSFYFDHTLPYFTNKLNTHQNTVTMTMYCIITVFYIIYIQDIDINTTKCFVWSRLGDIWNMNNLSYNASPGIELGSLVTPEQLRIQLGQLTDLKVWGFIEYLI